MIRVVTLIPAPMLEELLCDQIDRVSNFFLAGKASDPVDLFGAPARTHADVVISFWEDPDQAPEVFNELLSQFPHVLIVNILWDDDTVVLYRREISRHILPSVGVGRLLTQIRRFCEEATCDRTWLPAAVESHFEVSTSFLRLSLN